MFHIRWHCKYHDICNFTLFINLSLYISQYTLLNIILSLYAPWYMLIAFVITIYILINVASHPFLLYKGSHYIDVYDMPILSIPSSWASINFLLLGFIVGWLGWDLRLYPMTPTYIIWFFFLIFTQPIKRFDTNLYALFMQTKHWNNIITLHIYIHFKIPFIYSMCNLLRESKCN